MPEVPGADRGRMQGGQICTKKKTLALKPPDKKEQLLTPHYNQRRVEKKEPLYEEHLL